MTSSVSFSVVFPSLSSPNRAPSINARATGLPFISVFSIRTPDQRLRVPNAPSTIANASRGLGRRLAPRLWTWIALGSLICLIASRSRGKMLFPKGDAVAVRLIEGPEFDARCLWQLPAAEHSRSGQGECFVHSTAPCRTCTKSRDSVLYRQHESTYDLLLGTYPLVYSGICPCLLHPST